MKKNSEEKKERMPDYFLTWKEYYERKKVWNEYYAKVKESLVYKRFIEQKEAWENKDFEKVKKLANEAINQLESGYKDFQEPSFPDSVIDKVYGRLRIRELYNSVNKE